VPAGNTASPTLQRRDLIQAYLVKKEIGRAGKAASAERPKSSKKKKTKSKKEDK